MGGHRWQRRHCRQRAGRNRQGDKGDAPAAPVLATDAKDGAGHCLVGTIPESSDPPSVYPIALAMAPPQAYAAEWLPAHLRSTEVR